eukprot:TRINITY_DN33233_c0_g2_i2.p1 TRINITY_DN33233_c0_g2~~TRINITY_DN33233_c0_g2_i2.p1  ORF type:complete len:208 (+),score=52.00 TRINITY_DN33233_c0_g2_i2:193-816(+)
MVEKVKNIFLFAGDGDFLRTVSKIGDYPNKRLILICGTNLGNTSLFLQNAAHAIDDITADASKLLTGDKFSFVEKKAEESAPRLIAVQVGDAMDFLQDNGKWCSASISSKSDDGKVVLEDEYGAREWNLAEIGSLMAPLGTWTLLDENPDFPSGTPVEVFINSQWCAGTVRKVERGQVMVMYKEKNTRESKVRWFVSNNDRFLRKVP